MGTRSLERGTAAISSIKLLHPNADICALILNHLSLSSVVAAATSFTSAEPHLHGLVTNAGIMATPFALTPDGHEAQFQTNYLAHWLLTRLLLPTLLSTAKNSTPGDVRVVNISATAHAMGTPVGGIDFDDINQLKGTAFTRYSQSKLANLLHAKTLHQLYGPGSTSALAGSGEIWSAAVQPGFVNTGLLNKATGTWMFHLSAVIKAFVRLRGKVLDADEGSFTQLYVVASKGLGSEVSGKYFDERKEKLPSSQAMDQQLREKLERWTEDRMRAGGWIS
jgi:NAD(P)-dependent dehydrogenase (short-subunit alcohol dehydrogenase family)